MAWEAYTPNSRGRTAPGPQLTVGRKGSIGISAAALALLGDSSWCCLWFDGEAGTIAVTVATADDPRGLKLSRPERSQGASIAGKGFLEARGLDIGTMRHLVLREGSVLGSHALIAEPVAAWASPSVAGIRRVLAGAGVA